MRRLWRLAFRPEDSDNGNGRSRAVALQTYD